jgi:hypothetical protein
LDRSWFRPLRLSAIAISHLTSLPATAVMRRRSFNRYLRDLKPAATSRRRLKQEMSGADMRDGSGKLLT